jgi:hypothetical protein
VANRAHAHWKTVKKNWDLISDPILASVEAPERVLHSLETLSKAPISVILEENPNTETETNSNLLGISAGVYNYGGGGFCCPLDAKSPPAPLELFASCSGSSLLDTETSHKILAITFCPGPKTEANEDLDPSGRRQGSEFLDPVFVSELNTMVAYATTDSVNKHRLSKQSLLAVGRSLGEDTNNSECVDWLAQHIELATEDCQAKMPFLALGGFVNDAEGKGLSGIVPTPFILPYGTSWRPFEFSLGSEGLEKTDASDSVPLRRLLFEQLEQEQEPPETGKLVLQEVNPQHQEQEESETAEIQDLSNIVSIFKNRIETEKPPEDLVNRLCSGDVDPCGTLFLAELAPIFVTPPFLSCLAESLATNTQCQVRALWVAPQVLTPGPELAANHAVLQESTGGLRQSCKLNQHQTEVPSWSAAVYRLLIDTGDS